MPVAAVQSIHRSPPLTWFGWTNRSVVVSAITSVAPFATATDRSPRVAWVNGWFAGAASPEFAAPFGAPVYPAARMIAVCGALSAFAMTRRMLNGPKVGGVFVRLNGRML